VLVVVSAYLPNVKSSQQFCNTVFGNLSLLRSGLRLLRVFTVYGKDIDLAIVKMTDSSQSTQHSYYRILVVFFHQCFFNFLIDACTFCNISTSTSNEQFAQHWLFAYMLIALDR